MGLKFDVQPGAALGTVAAADSHGQTMQTQAQAAVNAAELLASDALPHAGGVAAAVSSFSEEVLKKTHTSVSTARHNNAEGTRSAIGAHQAGDAEASGNAQASASQVCTPAMPGGGAR